ncbi:hypothetical protein FXF62_06430 [Streptococcus cristatus]|uniref:Uncharacterized protein n=1 Tax=Streptococcus cristatus TaxID=45634 RepID=A0A5B0DFU3_STRCR|nr:hypothetical protein FXF62_06430 [Streptococcus cristatus]
MFFFFLKAVRSHLIRLLILNYRNIPSTCRLLNLDFLRVFALLFINMVSQVQALKKRRLGR